MSHIHIPDGVLPVWLVVAGWLGAAIVLGLAVRTLQGSERRRQVPVLGVFAALMLVGMSTEFIPIGYHINLTVVAGIILGPALGVIAAFVVDLILALFGHGGITVVGLNTLVIGAECALAWAVFRALYRLLARRVMSVSLLAGVTTVVTLFTTTLLLIGVVALGNAAPDRQWQAAILENPTLEGALSQGLFGNILLGGKEEQAEGSQAMSIGSFASLVLGLGAVGWIIEALITGVIIQFVYRVRRQLVVPQ